MNSQKQNRHSLMAKGIMVLLALLVLVFVLTYSWFTNPDEPVVASGLLISAHNSAVDFEYAIGFSNSRTANVYKRTQFINDSSVTLNLKELTADDANHTPYDLLYDYDPIDVSGNGVTLIRPAMNYGNWSVDTTSDNYSIAEPNVQYVSFDLIVRSHTRCVLSLSEDSYAVGACELSPGNGALSLGSGSDLSSDDIAKINTVRREKDSEGVWQNKNLSAVEAYDQSQYGGFSRDAIVGATRVAFINYTDNVTGAQVMNERQVTLNETPALLWIPRPDIYLNNNNNDSAVSGWSLNTGVRLIDTFDLRSESHTENPYSTYVHQYYSIINPVTEGQPLQKTLTTLDPRAQGSYVKASSIVTEGGNTSVKLQDSAKIMDINVPNDENDDGQISGDEYYYGKVNIRIWIEGTDSEARRALSGGDFGVFFDLTTH